MQRGTGISEAALVENPGALGCPEGIAGKGIGRQSCRRGALDPVPRLSDHLAESSSHHGPTGTTDVRREPPEGLAVGEGEGIDGVRVGVDYLVLEDVAHGEMFFEAGHTDGILADEEVVVGVVLDDEDLVTAR